MYPAAQTPIRRIPMATVHIPDFSNCVFSNPTSDPVACDFVSVTLLVGEESAFSAVIANGEKSKYEILISCSLRCCFHRFHSHMCGELKIGV